MPATSTIYRFGRFLLNPALRELSRDGEAVSCPRRVFDLVVYLVGQRERAVGRDELAAAVYGRVDVTDVQLGQLVLRARRAVDDDGTAQHSIATVPGFGYRWVAPTQAGVDDAPAVAPTVDETPVDERPDAPYRPDPPNARAVAIVALIALFGAAALWRAFSHRAAPPDPPRATAVVAPS
ncbi:MAG TPA: winged helix-turn-helix domain-containing protein, partial [Tahibacter sp.]|nr:winged helix-turn-helix domain-containing protein [Tahibacter sp.]